MSNVPKIYPKIFLLTLIVVVLTLGGCGTSFEGQPVSFGSFVMEIGQSFEETDVAPFETKSTKDHIIKAYKYVPNETDAPRTFMKNILVAIKENDEGVDTATFSKVSMKKIQTTFQGYEKIGLYKRKITCGEQTFIYYIHSYKFRRVVGDDEVTTYYITQAQRASPRYLYTVSASTDVQEDIELYEAYMKTIACTTK